MKTTCPFCDSENIEKITVEENYPIPFCEDAIIPHATFVCHNCEEEGDFDNSLDKALVDVLQKANQASAHCLIDYLVEKGITMTYLEKALRLPFRTTARWKRGEISHAALALLRLIRFSPELLSVADENFSEQAQATYNIMQPTNFMFKYFTNARGTMEVEGEKFELGYQGEFRKPEINSASMATHGITNSCWEIENDNKKCTNL